MNLNPAATAPERLTRAALARAGAPVAKPPVRIVHVGLGAFHRAHQAWYTAECDESGEWGIAAFTGRSAVIAEQLAPQDGLYTLIERSDAGDRLSVVPSIVEVADGADLHRFVELIASPTTAIVTLTITEPGYRLTGDGQPDRGDDAVSADIRWLSSALAGEHPNHDAAGAPVTSLGRLVLGLDARRRAGAGPIAVVPCDNMPGNGPLVRTGLCALAGAVSAETAAWIAQNVSFVSTSVDRITPKTTEDDVRTVHELSGWLDRAPVVTEPFSDWVLSGDFPAGRPAWESVGARFVDDIEPFERRKLWLLNGAHSLLAYAGRLRGHSTVGDAIADDACRRWVDELWDEAVRHLPADGLDLPEYRAALLRRFANTRIEHRLTQIGMEAVTKLRVRTVPVARAERAGERSGRACARVIGGWIALVLSGVALADAQSAAVTAIVKSPDAAGRERRLIAVLDPELAADDPFVASVVAFASECRSAARAQNMTGDEAGWKP